MTIKKLRDTLDLLVRAGHGRKPVLVNKNSFRHNCESDGVVILDVWKTSFRDVQWSDDDGGMAFRKDGTEKRHTALVLVGEVGEEVPNDSR